LLRSFFMVGTLVGEDFALIYLLVVSNDTFT